MYVCVSLFSKLLHFYISEIGMYMWHSYISLKVHYHNNNFFCFYCNKKSTLLRFTAHKFSIRRIYFEKWTTPITILQILHFDRKGKISMKKGNKSKNQQNSIKTSNIPQKIQKVIGCSIDYSKV